MPPHLYARVPHEMYTAPSNVCIIFTPLAQAFPTVPKQRDNATCHETLKQFTKCICIAVVSSEAFLCYMHRPGSTYLYNGDPSPNSLNSSALSRPIPSFSHCSRFRLFSRVYSSIPITLNVALHQEGGERMIVHS